MAGDEEVDLEGLRLLLLDQRAALIQEGDAEFEPNKVDPAARPDDDAQPLNEMNQVIASKRNKQRVVRLEHIEQALERLEREPDEFGYCADCEEPIKPGRLRVMPWALRCVKCEEKRNPRVSSRRRNLLDYD